MAKGQPVDPDLGRLPRIVFSRPERLSPVRKDDQLCRFQRHFHDFYGNGATQRSGWFPHENKTFWSRNTPFRVPTTPRNMALRLLLDCTLHPTTPDPTETLKASPRQNRKTIKQANPMSPQAQKATPPRPKKPPSSYRVPYKMHLKITWYI